MPSRPQGGMAEARTWRDEEQRGPHVPDLDRPETPRRLSASARADRVGREGDQSDHPLLFHRKGRPIKSFSRASLTCGDGDGWTQDGERVPPLRHRRGRDAERAGVKLQTFYDNAKAGPSSVVRFPGARARRGAKALRDENCRSSEVLDRTEKKWWAEAGLNRRHQDFQFSASVT